MRVLQFLVLMLSLYACNKTDSINIDNIKSQRIGAKMPLIGYNDFEWYKPLPKVDTAYLNEGKYYTLKNKFYNWAQAGATGNWDGADVLTDGVISKGSRWWRYNEVSKGYFKLFCDNDRLFDKKRVMEVFSGSLGQENVSLWRYNGGYHQQWKMIGTGDSKVFRGIIVNRKSGRMLLAKPDVTNEGHHPIISLWVGVKYDWRIHYEGSKFLPDNYIWNMERAN